MNCSSPLLIKVGKRARKYSHVCRGGGGGEWSEDPCGRSLGDCVARVGGCLAHLVTDGRRQTQEV